MMNDTDSTAGPGTPEVKTSPEPPSSPALAPPRGPSIWARLKAMLALRTVSLRDDLEVALESESNGETGDFTQSERTILKNVLELGEKRVDDVMVPRADIEAIDAEQSLGGLIARFRQVGHSRMPVYTDSIDNITGFIHVKDALRRITEPVTDPQKEIPVKLVSHALKQKIARLDIARTVLYVPPLMPVGDLLQQMQLQRVHMAIVIDEYGGTDGLVTLEDLVEELIGEVYDEHDPADRMRAAERAQASGPSTVRGELTLERFTEATGLDLEPGPYETVAGYLIARLGRLAVQGDAVEIDGASLTALAVRRRRIVEVRVERHASAS